MPVGRSERSCYLKKVKAWCSVSEGKSAMSLRFVHFVKVGVYIICLFRLSQKGRLHPKNKYISAWHFQGLNPYKSPSV